MQNDGCNMRMEVEDMASLSPPDTEDITAYPDLDDISFVESTYARFMAATQPKKELQSVVVPNEQGLSYSCCACHQRLGMKYLQNEEEWVHESCKLFGARPCHFPVCWEVIRREAVENAKYEAKPVTVDEASPDRNCALCNEPFRWCYLEDRWVYTDSKMILGKTFHYPDCWEYARAEVMKMLEDDAHRGMQYYAIKNNGDCKQCGICKKDLKVIRDFSRGEWVYEGCYGRYEEGTYEVCHVRCPGAYEV
ncbi:unnamed protein product [Ectocarpus sp. 6 AP-2014]